MSYSVKKAGVPFVAKINVNPDLTGIAANFSMFYIDDATKTKTAVTGSFVESVDAPGLYFSPTVTIPAVGDYTVNIVNTTDGLGNISSPVVVAAATIDDVDTAITNLRTVADTIAADVNGLNGTTLDGIRTSLADIKTLINDTTDGVVTIAGTAGVTLVSAMTVTGGTSGATATVTSSSYDGTNTTILLSNVTGTFVAGENLLDSTSAVIGVIGTYTFNTVNSVLEFVSQLDAALANGGSGLAALAGYTDDIENMLTGTRLLADGVTANPFYDATNPGVAKESSITAALATIQTDIANAQTAIVANSDANKNTLATAIAAVQTVVDANSASLSSAVSGLPALKTLIDTLQTSVNSGNTNVLAEINNATYGLAAIETKLVTMDGKLDTIVSTVSNISGTNTATAFI